ncbi:MAG: hypothetical protein B7Z22_13545 [Hyphomonas sp. 32-62-5]|nr:MAG: hypothetical protein B7Z22_13545 [Hyphomonas sp. 32-62-5]
MMIRALASLALLAAACLPAMADDQQDAADINATFAQGLASAEKPQTANEKWTCAVFWNVWTEFAELDLGTDFVALLDPALSQSSARTATSHWEKQATLAMGLGMGELDVETELYIEMQTESAWDMAEGVVWGDDYNYPFILGQCAVPAGE